MNEMMSYMLSSLTANIHRERNMSSQIEIAISNIAWDPVLDDAVIELLQTVQINKIEIAPRASFDNIDEITTADIDKYHQKWTKNGIETIAMQALLFGTTGFNIFSEESVQSDMLSYLDKIATLAQNLGASRLVFGSPKNRLLNGLNTEEGKKLYTRFFNNLGDIGAQRNCIFCVEPNPIEYGADFMTDSKSTAKVVRDLNHPNIMMQFDTGAMIMNREDFQKTIDKNFSLYGHFHLSMPHLEPLKKITEIVELGNILIDKNYKLDLSVEMKKVELNAQLEQMFESLTTAKKLFGR